MPTIKSKVFESLSHYSEGLGYNDLQREVEVSPKAAVGLTNIILDGIEEGFIIQDTSEKEVRYRLTDKGYSYVESIEG